MQPKKWGCQCCLIFKSMLLNVELQNLMFLSLPPQDTIFLITFKTVIKPAENSYSFRNECFYELKSF